MVMASLLAIMNQTIAMEYNQLAMEKVKRKICKLHSPEHPKGMDAYLTAHCIGHMLRKKTTPFNVDMTTSAIIMVVGYFAPKFQKLIEESFAIDLSFQAWTKSSKEYLKSELFR